MKDVTRDFGAQGILAIEFSSVKRQFVPFSHLLPLGEKKLVQSFVFISENLSAQRLI